MASFAGFSAAAREQRRRQPLSTNSPAALAFAALETTAAAALMLLVPIDLAREDAWDGTPVLAAIRGSNPQTHLRAGSVACRWDWVGAQLLLLAARVGAQALGATYYLGYAMDGVLCLVALRKA